MLPGGALPGIGPNATDQSVTLHLVAAAVFAAGFGVAGFFAQGRSINAIVPVVWSAAGVVHAAGAVDRALRPHRPSRPLDPVRDPRRDSRCGLSAARPKSSTRRENRPGLMISTALFATGTLGALALALTFALEKGWLTIALALMSMGTAWISMQRPIPFLRSLAAILAGIVVLRIGYEPRIAGDAVGTTPIFNWLLWGYGIPAASFWIASIFLRRRGDDAPLRMVEVGGDPVHGAAGVHGDPPRGLWRRHLSRRAVARRSSRCEVCAALAMAIGLERLRLRTNSIVHDIGAVLLTAFAGFVGVFGLLLLENPHSHDRRARRRRRSTCCCWPTRCRPC